MKGGVVEFIVDGDYTTLTVLCDSKDVIGSGIKLGSSVKVFK